MHKLMYMAVDNGNHVVYISLHKGLINSLLCRTF